MRHVAVAFRPHAWVNVHSGMEGLFMPYDHVAVIPEGPDAAASLAILQVLPPCGKACRSGVARVLLQHSRRIFAEQVPELLLHHMIVSWSSINC